MSTKTEKNELEMEGDNWKLVVYPKNLDIGKSWLIQLDYTDPVTGETFRDQCRKGINYKKIFPLRFKEAKGFALVKLVSTNFEMSFTIIKAFLYCFTVIDMWTWKTLLSG